MRAPQFQRKMRLMSFSQSVDPCVSRANFCQGKLENHPQIITYVKKRQKCIKHASFKCRESLNRQSKPLYELMVCYLSTLFLPPILSTVGTVEFPVQKSSVLLDGLTCEAIRPLVAQMKRCRFFKFEDLKVQEGFLQKLGTMKGNYPHIFHKTILSWDLCTG